MQIGCKQYTMTDKLHSEFKIWPEKVPILCYAIACEVYVVFHELFEDRLGKFLFGAWLDNKLVESNYELDNFVEWVS